MVYQIETFADISKEYTFELIAGSAPLYQVESSEFVRIDFTLMQSHSVECREWLNRLKYVYVYPSFRNDA